MNRNVLAAALTATLLTACGGGGGGGGDNLPESRPEGAAKGIAQHGPIVNAEISAYDWDGSRGEHRGTTRTDSEGKYSLDISVSDRPLLIGSREGSYAEESTGRSVQMGNDELTAVIFYESGRDVDVQLTYFTTLATCRAEYLINEDGQTVGNAINIANNEWSAILGVDIVGVQPVDVTKSSAFTPFMTPSHQYGVALAGVSELVDMIRVDDGADENNSTYTVKYLTKVACSDMRHDGKLDGIAAPTAGNPSGQLYIGSTALNVDLYRQALGQGVIAFGDNKNNQTGLSAADFLELANGIAISSSAVFGGVEGTPVDNEGPVITSTIAAGSLLNGTAEVAFNVSDPLGVKNVSFYIDGELYAEGQPINPTLNWITTVYSDGEHTVRVVATDVLNNESAEEFTYVVANTGPSVVFTSSNLVNNSSYLATGTYSALTANVDRIEVNGVVATLDENAGTWEAEVTLVGSQTLLQAVIFDELGNDNAAELVVEVDLIKPVINSRDTLVTYTDFSGQLNLCEYGDFNDDSGSDRPICLNAEKISLDGAEVSRSLMNDDYILVGVEVEDPQGQGVFTSIGDLDIEYTVSLNGTTTIDWQAVPRPDRNQRAAYIPVTSEYFGDGYHQVSRDDVFVVEVRVRDLAGNTDTIIYTFALDVLTPPLAFDTSLNQSIFNESFEDRTALVGKDVVVSYSYENQSNLAYLLRLDASDEHGIANTVESATRRHLVRLNTYRNWSVSAPNCTRPDGSCAGTEWRTFHDFKDLTIYNTSGTSFVRTDRLSDTVGGWQSISADTIVAPSSTTVADERYGWCYYFSNNLRCALSTDTGIIHLANVVTDYEYESQEGYPRNEFSQTVENYTFQSQSLRVFNETTGTEIFPTDGWYLVPKNTEIRVDKTARIPLITHYMDSRVSADDISVPYNESISEDLSIQWSIDTDLQVSRAIYPGSMDDLDSVSLTQSVEGLGIVNYTIARN